MKKILIFLAIAMLVGCSSPQTNSITGQATSTPTITQEQTTEKQTLIMFAGKAELMTPEINLQKIEYYDGQWHTLQINEKYKLYENRIMLSQGMQAGITKIKLTINNVTIDGQPAILAGKEIEIETNLEKEDMVYEITFYPESVRKTTDGQIVFAPVIQTRILKGKTTVLGNREIKITGTTRTEQKIGMDINGNTGIGKGLPATSEIYILNGAIKIRETEIIKPDVLIPKSAPELKLKIISDRINPAKIEVKPGEYKIVVWSLHNYTIKIEGITDELKTEESITAKLDGRYEIRCLSAQCRNELMGVIITVNR